MNSGQQPEIRDTGERMLPPAEGEISFVFARHRFAYEFALNHVADATVIDVGCGSGYGCRILAARARFVRGYDWSEEAVAYCRHHFSAPNIEFHRAEAAAITTDESADVVVSFQVIEHVGRPADFLAILRRLTKPGGTIIVTTPNVRKNKRTSEVNPFHLSEMNHGEFEALLKGSFTSFELLGVVPARKNLLRDIIGRTPLVRLGRFFKRGSRVKKIANRVLDMSEFRIIRENVGRDADDLLAVCRNI